MVVPGSLLHVADYVPAVGVLVVGSLVVARSPGCGHSPGVVRGFVVALGEGRLVLRNIPGLTW